MLLGYERVYLLTLDKDHFYVGSTTKEVHVRYKEHAEGNGSRWTSNHPPRGCVCWMRVPIGTSTRIENELTKYMMYTQGWGKVRGGDWVFARCKSRLWLPRELRSFGPGHVSMLHGSRVAQFLPQTRRIIEFLEMSSGLKNPQHLDADSFPEVRLRSRPDQLHHVDTSHPVSVPLCAK